MHSNPSVPEEGQLRAKEVHAVLNRELGPAMKDMGFQRTGSAMAIWRQPIDPDGIDPRNLFVATHIARLGFDEHSGGWFTIELWVGETANPGGQVVGNFASYFDFLSPANKLLLLELTNLARAVIPAHQGQPPEDSLTTDALPYYRAEHVAAYAQVLRDMLPHVITVFALTRSIPPPAQVTDAL